MNRVGTQLRNWRITRNRRRERGIALLIAIFVLLLVCVIGIALVISSGTESSLAGNYRSSTLVYYAALAGLEEGRGRLYTKSPQYLNTTNPGFLATGSTPLPFGQVRYILNPSPGEVVDPTTFGTTYYDSEFDQEFGSAGLSLASASSSMPTPATSTSSTGGIQGPVFKWVRLNGATERSTMLDVNQGGALNATALLYYDEVLKTVVRSSGSNRKQLIEVTALAAMPDGTRRILQYLVAPDVDSLSFPAALTVAGKSMSLSTPDPPYGTITYQYPAYPPSSGSYTFTADGVDDRDCNGNTVTGLPSVYGLGWTDSGLTYGTNGSTLVPSSAYEGSGAMPSAANVGANLPTDLQNPSKAEQFLTSLEGRPGTQVISGPTTTLPGGMSATNPMTIVVNGDLDLSSGASTGYGLLVVTGTFTYSPDTTWKGVVLVIGKGVAEEVGGPSGTGRFDGAFFVARSRDGAGATIPGSSFGPSYLELNSPAGSKFSYNSCWIEAAIPPTGYKVLSFREVPE